MITLQNPRMSDLAVIKKQIAWLNNKDLMRFSEQRHKLHTVTSQMAYIQSFVEHGSNILREILSDDELVGTISANVDTINRVANVGILIGGEFASMGIGSDAWAQFCDWLFDTLDMRRVEGGCMAANEKMIEVFRKYGMKEEGRRMSHFAFEGGYTDLVLYGRFR